MARHIIKSICIYLILHRWWLYIQPRTDSASLLEVLNINYSFREVGSLMEDEAILLKIKREFTQNEAVQSLLKIISTLESEIGILKSELEETKYMASEAHKRLEKEQIAAKRLREEGGKTKKEWLKDELIAELDHLFQAANKNAEESKKELSELSIKYYALLMKTQTKE